MQVGEVRIARDEDFQRFRSLADSNDGWALQYNKHGIRVFTKQSEPSTIRMVKVTTDFDDISASIMYDVLHDPDYRKKWDESMIESYEICKLDNHNDIGYYSAKCPAPMRNRDFLLQRSWSVQDGEYLIFNHSVQHKKYLERKECIRALSFLTGYMVTPLDSGGSSITYLAHSDPRGKLPKWLVNKVSTKIAPRIVVKLHRAARNYKTWKSEHDPDHKPWLYPEQNKLPILNWEDVDSITILDQAVKEDLSAAVDTHVDSGDDNGDNNSEDVEL